MLILEFILKAASEWFISRLTKHIWKTLYRIKTINNLNYMFQKSSFHLHQGQVEIHDVVNLWHDGGSRRQGHHLREEHRQVRHLARQAEQGDCLRPHRGGGELVWRRNFRLRWTHGDKRRFFRCWRAELVMFKLQTFFCIQLNSDIHKTCVLHFTASTRNTFKKESSMECEIFKFRSCYKVWYYAGFRFTSWNIY